jgi:hypothetical protein
MKKSFIGIKRDGNFIKQVDDKVEIISADEYIKIRGNHRIGQIDKNIDFWVIREELLSPAPE